MFWEETVVLCWSNNAIKLRWIFDPMLGFFTDVILFVGFCFQLDLCSEMAKFLAWSSTPFALWFPESFCMVCCCFSNYGAYHLGLLVDCNIESRPDRFGCNNGLLLAFYSIMLWWRTQWQSSSMYLLTSLLCLICWLLL